MSAFGFFKKLFKGPAYIHDDVPVEDSMFYAELPPKERIERLFTEHISPLLEQNGFALKKSGFYYVRTQAGFTHQISLKRSKWNRANQVCAFTLTLAIHSEKFEQWMLSNLQEDHDGLLLWVEKGGVYGWPQGYRFEFDLASQNNLKVFETIKHNLVKDILPFFDRMSGFGIIADTLMAETGTTLHEMETLGTYRWIDPVIPALYLADGNLQKAETTLQAMTRAYHADRKKDFRPGYVEELEKRVVLLQSLMPK